MLDGVSGADEVTLLCSCVVASAGALLLDSAHAQVYEFQQ